ncbi:MAG: hypothetical protein FD130_1535, partial [Halothiobacillaceae bacterium]
EAAAQAAAAWEVLRRRASEGETATARIGYLVGLRDVLFFTERIPAGETLGVTVILEAAAPPLHHYRVALTLRGQLLAQGMIATFLQEGGE